MSSFARKSMCLRRSGSKPSFPPPLAPGAGGLIWPGVISTPYQRWLRNDHVTLWANEVKVEDFWEPLGKISLFFRDCCGKSVSECHSSWMRGQLLQPSVLPPGWGWGCRWEEGGGKRTARKWSGSHKTHLPQSLKYIWTWVLWAVLHLILQASLNFLLLVNKGI